MQQYVEVRKETTRYFARLRGMLQIRTVAEPCLDRYLLLTKLNELTWSMCEAFNGWVTPTA